MSKLILNALQLSHSYAERLIQPGDRVVDATCGNGGDTVFLAELVGPNGHVDGFDIQAQALKKTRERLAKAELTDRCSLHQISHDQMGEFVAPNVRCVLFNLGYLPGGDHAIGTRSETTLPALEQALELICVGGAVLICLYYGGDSGFDEHEAVLSWISHLSVHQYAVQKMELANALNCPPIFICCEKLA